MGKGAERVSVGWFLYDPETEKVLMHQRNDKKSGNPKEWDYFGGGGKKGETPEEALRRELREELRIDLQRGKVKPLSGWIEGNYHKCIFYLLPTREDKKNMRLCEGSGMGWFSFDDALKLGDLAPDACKQLRLLREKVRVGRSNLPTQAARRQAAS